MINWLFSFFTDRTFGIARSQFWDEVRDEYVRENPKCAVCGSTKIAVHHKFPFFLRPDLELEKGTNLISLCDWRANNCHWRFGHIFQSWMAYNEKIDEVAEIMRTEREKVKNKP